MSIFHPLHSKPKPNLSSKQSAAESSPRASLSGTTRKLARHMPLKRATSGRTSSSKRNAIEENDADAFSSQILASSPQPLASEASVPTSTNKGHSSQGSHLNRGGSPLPQNVASFFQHRIPHDIRDVRLHQGKETDLLSKSMGANAFAFENHIWLSSRIPIQPNHTLAHELAHVFQWQQGAASRIRADIFDKSLVQQLTEADFEGVNTETVERLVASLSAYIENFDEGSVDRLALQENLDVASQVLGDRTTSRPTPPEEQVSRPQRRRRPNYDTASRRRDIQRIMNLVQEVHVSDDEEAEILTIIERYATTRQRFDSFLTALDNRHYYGGAFGGYHFRSGITAVKRELEGARGRRFKQLLQRKSRRFSQHEVPDEITFAGSFWQDLSEGQIRDQIFAYFQGMGEAGVAMAESIVMLVRDPGGFIEALGELPDNIARFWRNREQLINAFTSASPTEQARIIGRIFGEAEVFLATSGAGAAATPARGALVTVPVRAEAVVAVGRGSAALSAGGAITVDLGRLGPVAAQGAQMAAHTSQTAGGSRAMSEAADTIEDAAPSRSTSSSGSSSRSTPSTSAEEARRLEILEEFADAQSSTRRPDVAPEGTRNVGTTTRPRTSSLTDAEVLAANLERTAGTRPPGHHAHHIIPKGMQDAAPSRAILERFNININSELNGVWLARDYIVANPNTGQIHSTLHTRRYIGWINQELTAASAGGRTQVLEALSSIRSQILNGNHPL
ncbi:AHH domain-containing protein [Enterovibrio sp. ZSDZ35]|uniref:AHH domain-containing protein n=1 Tax=Enterovibrio qingdaonensis TaxID=2899818 RepID=A0ABT5QIV7_9GAMM|nr:AHH domain-containing protein [Enterovibrio sp. ZSDZ35]MDD1780926.1 AHH domain-containing protein [Enterovibrio sp. ZSDZ35]